MRRSNCRLVRQGWDSTSRTHSTAAAYCRALGSRRSSERELQMPSDGMVTIARCSTPTEASILKGKLDSAGIWSILVDAETIGMHWLFSNALGGVKLRVRAPDAELARELLRETPPELPQTVGEADEAWTCPECGSKDTEYERFSRKFAFITWILMMVPLPYWKNSWKCRKCGCTWKEVPDDKPPAGA